jgi:hypothetical protein
MSPHKDPVTPELRELVLAMDGYRCVARTVAKQLGEPLDLCRALYGDRLPSSGRQPLVGLTLDHVPDKMGEKKGMSIAGDRKGVRAPSDVQHLVTLCWHHHLNGWATSHRDALRAHIAARGGMAA